MNRPAVIALVAATAIVLAGCTSSDAAEPSAAAAPPANSTPTPEPLADAYPDDHTIPLELVEDERGTYMRVTIDKDSPFATFDPAIVDESVELAGFTEAEARRAHALAVRFLVEQMLDGPKIELNGMDAAEWYKDNKLVTIANWTDAASFAETEGDLVLEGLRPDSPRDGQQRVAITGAVTSIAGTESEAGVSYLTVKLDAEAVGRASEESVRAWLGEYLETDEQVQATLEEHYPTFLENGGGDIKTTVTGLRLHFSYSDLANGFISGWKLDSGGGSSAPLQ